MKKFWLLTPLISILCLSGCKDSEANREVISKRYMHKYGYAVSESEWKANQYPGQVITSMRNGITITATYENGLLHGPTTHTHPHSQTVQRYYLYQFGRLTKEIEYDGLGMPIQEKARLSPQRICITKWYGDGTPMSVEDFAGKELLDGTYYTLTNEVEAEVKRGHGMRVSRNQYGTLLSKDYFDGGYLVKKEAFYPSGSPESVTHFTFNKKHGQRKVFTQNGDLQAVEEWVDGKLYGKAIYYMNGKKQMEIFFINGARNGTETHFVDGEHIEQEIHWIYDKRHGPTHFYVNDAIAKTEWFYDGKQVSKRRFDELDQMDKMISQSSHSIDETVNR